MSCNILFSNKMVGKNINVEKNDKGWYKVALGQVNAFNNHQEYYLEEGIKELLSEQDSYLSVKNRLESGLLKGECTHPIREGHSDSDWLTRNLIINDAMASHQFMEIMLETSKEVSNGRPVLTFWAWILPTDNEHGRSLKADLDNPDINVAFSIRCFSKKVPHLGLTARVITKIICWDRIDIPGLKNAVKGGDIGSITKEAGLKEIMISDSTLDHMLASDIMTTESAGLKKDIMDLKNSMDNNHTTSLFHNW